MKNYPDNNDERFMDKELSELCDKLQAKNPHAAVVLLISEDGIKSAVNCKGSLLTQISMIKSALGSLMKKLTKETPLGGNMDPEMMMKLMELFKKMRDRMGDDDDDSDDNRRH